MRDSDSRDTTKTAIEDLRNACYRAAVGAIAPERLPGQLRSAIADLERRFPGLGLTLFVFDFDAPGGGVAYISNAERADMVQMLRAWLRKEVAQS